MTLCDILKGPSLGEDVDCCAVYVVYRVQRPRPREIGRKMCEEGVLAWKKAEIGHKRRGELEWELWAVS